ncbi:hypothetical protein PHYBOEH_008851 [Phytophthora boehmeriae]|uniref:Uncharacterized protein n=1 Tax=Phytophthora boehmeriae TaxID=109152 RepID=A0A8T1X6H7_9STRA|nr:hypothetical protein PHYBOEH_008851 [Phytophthora boehmeriae]
MTVPGNSTSSHDVSVSVQSTGASVRAAGVLQAGVDSTAHDTGSNEENTHMRLSEIGLSSQGSAMSVPSSSGNERDVTMNPSDLLDDLDHEVGFVRDNTIGQKSKDVYMCGITRFVVWLHEHQAGLLAAALCDQLDASSNGSTTTRVRQTVVRTFMNDNPSVPPLDLDQLNLTILSGF